MHCGKEIILFIIEYVIVYGNTRGDKLGYTTLHKFFCHLGVLELVAYGNTLSGTYELWKVCIERVEGKTCHFGYLRRRVLTIGTLGEGNAQNFRCNQCIGTICFVKIATTEKQNGIGVLCLKLHKLAHHWGYGCIFFGHIIFKYKTTLISCEDSFFCRKSGNKKQKWVIKNKFPPQIFKNYFFYIFLQFITSTM